jgi:WD40 repeat protein
MTPANCPNQAELRAFNLGDLPLDRVEAIAAHLEACPACEAAVRNLDAVQDQALVLLRRSGEITRGPTSGSTPLAVDELPPLAPMPDRIGEYQLLNELGRGGMGVVYRAWHEPLRRLVALKMMLASRFADAKHRARFHVEAEAFARLQHPNIVQVHGIGEHEGQPYFTLEYVDGGTLANRLGDKPAAPEQAAAWLETLALAVAHAHGQGLVHRDLKPSNVLLTAEGQLKIVDFGLAKLLQGASIETGSRLIVGTPEYMAPEQAVGQAVGPTADIYSLGVLLYVCLTGRPPFQGLTPLDTLTQACERNPVPPRQLQPKVPRDLETICLKCLEKEPRRRYANAAALAEDLRRFLDGRPVVARPSPIWERAWKWARRRPAVAGLSAAVVLVTALTLVLTSWLWLRAEDRAEQARLAKITADEGRQQAEEIQARLALRQGQALCEQGDIRRGLLWMASGLEKAQSAGATALERPLRINLAEWAARLDRPLGQLHNPAHVHALAFDPSGHLLLASGRDGRIHWWDVQTGKEDGTALVHPTGILVPWVASLAFSPDGRRLATGGHGGVAVWDVARRVLDGKVLEHEREVVVWGIAFLPDGQHLATASSEGAVRIWDLASRRVVLGPLWHVHNENCFALAISPDGKLLASGGNPGRAQLWDLAKGEPIGPPLQHPRDVLSVAFSKDGSWLLTSTRGGTLHTWDTHTGRAVDLPAHGDEITCVRFSPDGRWFATGAGDGVGRLWDAITLKTTGPVYRFREGITALTFSPDGRRLAFGSPDGTIHLVELSASRAVGPGLRLPSEVHAVLYTPDGRRLLTSAREGAQWWDSETGKPYGNLLPMPEGCDLEAAVLSPDGTALARGRWASPDGRNWFGAAELEDPATGQRRWRTPDLPRTIRVTAFSPDGRTLFVAGGEVKLGGAGLWDVASGRRERTLFQALGNVHVQQAVFFPDGRTLLAACDDGQARLWDVTTDAEVHSLLHASAVTACALDRSGERMLTGCQDGTARLWDATTQRPLLAPLRHEAEVKAVAFSPDGRTLLTGSRDGTARFWDAGTGEPLGPALRHADAVRTVAFHPDGHRVATGSSDRTAQQWLVPAPALEGDPAAVRLWAEVLSGMELDAQGAVQLLTAPAVEERQRLLHGFFR